MAGNECGEESIWGRHVIRFWDVPLITELSEMLHTCCISCSSGRHKGWLDGKASCRSKRQGEFWHQIKEVFITIRSPLEVEMIFGGNKRAERTGLYLPSLRWFAALVRGEENITVTWKNIRERRYRFSEEKIGRNREGRIIASKIGVLWASMGRSEGF